MIINVSAPSIESSVVHFRKRSISNSIKEKFYPQERKEKYFIMVLGSICYYGMWLKSHDIIQVEGFFFFFTVIKVEAVVK